MKFIIAALLPFIVCIGLCVILIFMLLPSAIGILFGIDSVWPFAINILWLMILSGILFS